MIVFRLFRVVLHVAIAFWICALVFPFTDAAGRAWRTRRWSAQLLSICRVQLEIVAKSDIRDWPLIGWLCALAGTVFIARGRPRDVRRIFHDLVVSIQNGERIAFFPEGTTARQGGLLPFHANLFEAAIDAQVPIQPYALRYLDAQGRLHPTVDFVDDMTFVQSMFAVLMGEKITAYLIILPLIETAGAHRREVAHAAREAIAKAMHYST
jgi:1-acyl-sn-glycerol-3-phosphate acyltransferase